jgi:hypothetical protein
LAFISRQGRRRSGETKGRRERRKERKGKGKKRKWKEKGRRRKRKERRRTGRQGEVKESGKAKGKESSSVSAPCRYKIDTRCGRQASPFRP